MRITSPPSHAKNIRRFQMDPSGVALVIVLAMVVLMAGLVVAFFSRAISERQVSNSSANQTKVELFAQGATDQIIGDLKQEIVAGSNASSPAAGVNIYTPKAPATVVPALVGSTGAGGLENLIKRSVSGTPFYTGTNYNTAAYPAPNRAANVSTTAASQNGRFISAARWNKPYLLPAANATDANAPDWILVGRDGSNPNAVTANPAATNYVIGRYAYNIYDEGGLLDINVAGSPMTLDFTGTATKPLSSIAPYKNALAYADLSQLPGFSNSTSASKLSGSDTRNVINAIVGWRNFASAGPVTGTFPSYTAFAKATPPSILPPFDLATLANTKGFLSPGNTTLVGGQSDKVFTSRQQLIDLFRAISGAVPAFTPAVQQQTLLYLTTFNRALNQPSFAPSIGRPTVLSTDKGGNNAAPNAPGVTTPLDDRINPNFLTVRVGNQKAAGRNDGSDLKEGEPLVKERFALKRLAWLTYAGPLSQNGATFSSNVDANYIATLKNRHGLSEAFLLQGTAANIQKYFGLTWNSGVWKYNLHNGGGTGAGSIMRLGDIAALSGAAQREADFFELLKASLHVGSLGRASSNSSSAVASPGGGINPREVPLNYRYTIDTSVDYQVIQIGANIIDQSDLDGFPTRISFDSGSVGSNLVKEFQGVESVPYLNYVFNATTQAQRPTSSAPRENDKTFFNGRESFAFAQSDPTYGVLSDPGVGVFFQVPALWNPYDSTGSVGVPRPTQFRVVVDSTDPDHLDDASSYTRIYTASQAFKETSGDRGGSSPVNSFSADGNSPNSPSYPQDLYNRGRAGVALNSGNTALEFTDMNGSLFREPTLLLWPGGATSANVVAPAGTRLKSDFPSGIPNTVDNPLGFPTSAPAAVLSRDRGTPANKTNYLGFYLGAFPLRFKATANSTALTVTAYQASLYRATGAGGSGDSNNVYLTYRVQYQDPGNSSQWITFDTKYAKTTTGYQYYRGNEWENGLFPTSILPSQASWSSAIDPRTARFGMVMGTPRNSWDTYSSYPPPGAEREGGDTQYTRGWVDPFNGALLSPRPDRDAGFYFIGGYVNGPQGNPAITGNLAGQDDVPLPVTFPGWTSSTVENRGDYSAFPVGMLSQNNTGIQVRRGRFYGDRGFRDNGGEFRIMNPVFYADPDGVVRRAMGGYIPNGGQSYSVSPRASSSDASIGLPLARATSYNGSYSPPSPSPVIQANSATSLNQMQSRPLMLNRPFRSVGELGYVFRDTPWKNIDFFTPESGDTALLDVFCISETEDKNKLVAGRISLNTKQPAALAAIISGAYVDDPKISDATVGQLSPTLAKNIGSSITARMLDLNTPGFGPFLNVGQLVGKWNTKERVANPPANTQNVRPVLDSDYQDGRLSYVGFSGSEVSTSPSKDLNSVYAESINNADLLLSLKQIQRFHEAPIRALSNVSQTRVWNLLVDVVAQTGRYPNNAANLASFSVDGEQRYWVHLAIDRMTGEILDKQVEVVKE